MIHLLILPVRVAFGVLFGILAVPFALATVIGAVLFVPFLLLRFVFKTAVGLFVMPFVLLGAVIAIVATLVAISLALFVPFLPFAVVGLCLWYLMQRSPAASVVRG